MLIDAPHSVSGIIKVLFFLQEDTKVKVNKSSELF